MALHFVAMVMALTFSATAAEKPCVELGEYVEVRVSKSELILCEQQVPVRSFKVAFGRGGFDKRAQGDRKTPLGQYALGTPRASERFFEFIPIGYPTGTQRAEGFTGGDVGIHGPAKKFAWLGFLNSWWDWTDGCIAVATEREIAEVSSWVKTHRATSVTIR